LHCLLLNADASPVTILPLSTLTWQESIRYLVNEKATVLEWHDDWIVQSSNWETKVPAVLILKEYHKKRVSVRYSKMNVFIRDRFRCTYCNEEVTHKTATIDHVLPTSLGGKSTFENTVCACSTCNGKKGNDKRIKPKLIPYKPSYWELVNNRKKMAFDIRHPSWIQYLG